MIGGLATPKYRNDVEKGIKHNININRLKISAVFSIYKVRLMLHVLPHGDMMDIQLQVCDGQQNRLNCKCIGGSVVECSPAVRAARVRFPADAHFFPCFVCIGRFAPFYQLTSWRSLRRICLF